MRNNDEIRAAAQSIYENISTMSVRSQPTTIDIARSHSINLITEEFLGGYTQDGRMSVVRRFFCLFVAFDMFFISLLWLICVMVSGDNIYNALKTQVLHYSIYTSLFDIVVVAIFRFLILALFYAVFYINHWIIIALCTSGSCMFLISKVFMYDWTATPQPVFQVVLIVVSFVLSWGEAWFLDCRVIPQERHARRYFAAITGQPTDRSPLIAPLLQTTSSIGPDAGSNFYSPYESGHNSDDENEQDDEYRRMGIECVRKAYELLESGNWKVEKVTPKGDTISSTSREKLGKIYRLTGRIKYPAKLLLEELFYKIEDVPKWNPTLLESKVVRKINTYCDVSYQATVGGGGGMVKPRDFVNLRCWRLCKNGDVVEYSDDEDEAETQNPEYDVDCAGSVSTVSEEDFLDGDKTDSFKKSQSEAGIESKMKDVQSPYTSLSKSLGAKDFGPVNSDPPPLDEDNFADANDKLENDNSSVTSRETPRNDKIYVSAAFSIDYPAVPPTSKYTRGENLVSCWAMREVANKPESCIFEWLLCLDLKGYIPRYVLDAAYTTLMQDYMTYLRKYCTELRHKRKKVPARISS
ncbi:unnamed protein product [Hermetia illucens]|uniref:Uncharacterized protein n=1 Tax=Hermetia illucens TaxID=343691 RepID=A0A7R8UC41_HERIL|nr:steroidogenic acute regulatory protein-like isoform X2 [Hermetia illucens]CAD7078058.1 unnamed protein product [Hermetia illucens]